MPIFSCRHFEDKKKTLSEIGKVSVDIVDSHSCANVFEEFGA